MSEAVRGRMRDRLDLVDGRSLLSLMNLMSGDSQPKNTR